jgi:hypothetical protein
MPALMSQIGLAGDRHQPGYALGDQIESALVSVGAAAAVARDRAVDERRVDLRERVVAKAELFHRAAAIVFGDYVALRGHALERFARGRQLEVERDAALVAVHRHERSGFAVDFRPVHAPCIVAARDALDLDHVGAHVREQHAAGGTRHDLRELDHLQAGERSHVGASRAQAAARRPPA